MAVQLNHNIREYHDRNVSKRYLREAEAADEFALPSDEVITYSIAAGALYRLPRTNLIHRERMETFMKHKGDEKYYLIMCILGTTGIRIQELSKFTLEALLKNNGNIVIRNKNKTRIVPLPAPLKKELLQYATKQHITSGAVFLGNRGTPITREAVWKKLKLIAEAAGVNPDKIYPHAFRHFFAFTYIEKYHNVCTLADILGHSRVETTRIYLQQTLDDTRVQIDSMYTEYRRHIRSLQMKCKAS